MNNLNKIIILYFFFALSIYSSVPTVEGIFRNPNNKDLSGNTVVLKLLIKKSESNEDIQKVATEEETLLSMNQYYVKYIFSIDGSRVRLLQAIYSDKKMESKYLLSVKYLRSIRSNEFTREKKLFYAVLSSLALNRSNELVDYLKTISKNFKTNSDLMNRDKNRLIRSYKKYLKNKSTGVSGLVNPLKDVDENEKKRIKDLMDKPFIEAGKALTLLKRGDGFLWMVTLDNFQGEFENESLRMKKIEFNNLSSIDTFSFGSYLLLDGVHEFPRIFRAKFGELKYEINVLGLLHFESKSKKIITRVNDYLNKMKKLKLKNHNFNEMIL